MNVMFAIVASQRQSGARRFRTVRSVARPPSMIARDLDVRDINARNADARLVAKLDGLLVVMHARGRHAISILDTGYGDSDVVTSLVHRAPEIGFTAVDVVGLRHAANCAGQESLSATTEHSPVLRVTLVQPDGRGRLPFDDGEFDIVILVEGANRELVKECERVTCRGGVLVPRY